LSAALTADLGRFFEWRRIAQCAISASMAIASRALPLLALLLCIAACAPVPSPGAAAVGAPGSAAARQLYLPASGQASAGVVVLHGCSGVGNSTRQWAQRLADWGYAALLIDSFGPRGYTNVCNRGGLVSPNTQARDAFDGAAYLRSRTDLGIRRVGVIGFSHGGSAVVKAVLAGLTRGPGDPPFDAAVAFYPGCSPAGRAIESDTLVLIGDADDWSSPTRCAQWRDTIPDGGHSLTMDIYPGALHAFDSPAQPHWYYGHYIGQQPEARADSIEQTRAFFAARLGGAS
jgi:dienelactone hydrolase